MTGPAPDPAERHRAETAIPRAHADVRSTDGSEVAPAWSVPAAPVAARIRATIVDTGDDAATVACGLNVEAEWAIGVLTGAINEVDLDHVQRLSEALHCSPYDLFGAQAARSIAHAYGPELWPRHIEPLEPLGWEIGADSTLETSQGRSQGLPWSASVDQQEFDLGPE